MTNRSAATVLLLAPAFLAALAGCSADAKESMPERDAAHDVWTRTDASDVTASTGDLVSAAGDAPVGGPADMVPTPDAQTDAPSTADAGVPSQGDAPSSHDASPDIVADGTIAMPAEAARPIDGSTADDGARPIDGTTSAACQGMLLDNTDRPDNYPVVVREPTNAADRFATRKAELLAAYGLGDADYTFDSTAITWAATIKQGMGACALKLGTVTVDTVTATAQSFLSRWGDFFQYANNGTPTTAVSCYNKFCSTELKQDYCGLPVSSSDLVYRGWASVLLYASDGCVNRAESHFVPMVPLPRNVLRSDTALKQAIVGQTLTYQCAAGPGYRGQVGCVGPCSLQKICYRRLLPDATG
jgi:hypothetical protein